MYRFSVLLALTVIVVSFAGSEVPGVENLSSAGEKLTTLSNHESVIVRRCLVWQPEGINDSLCYSTEYNTQNHLTADFYYPAGFDFSQKLPAVILINGVGDGDVQSNYGMALKDMAQYVSWAAALAATGVIGVTYEATRPNTDIDQLMAFIRDEGPNLGIDPARLGVWICSANGKLLFQTLTDPTKPYHGDIRAMAVLYAITRPWGTRPSADVSWFLAKAGKDDADINRQMDALAAEVMDVGAVLQFVEYPEGRHAFDIRQDEPRAEEIIRECLGFFASFLEL